MEGDDEEDDVDDLENEFNYVRGTSKARREWQGEDVDLSSSSRHESQPIRLLTNGQPVSEEFNLFSMCIYLLLSLFIFYLAMKIKLVTYIVFLVFGF